MGHLLIQWHAMVLFMLIRTLPSRGNSTDDELMMDNVVCEGLGSCGSDRSTDDIREVNCQCGPVCARLGTCCFDSPYRRYQGDVTECFKPRDDTALPVYLVTSCSPYWPDDSVKELCKGDPKDLYLKVPVTHPRTGITYRNFYCYTCNFEDVDVDPPVSWDVKLGSARKASASELSHLTYDANGGAWYIGGEFVHISESVPTRIRDRVRYCRDEEVINTCDPTWTDDATRYKCGCYTALVFVSDYSFQVRYRNPHCAICNFKEVSEMVCKDTVPSVKMAPTTYGFVFTGIFSTEDKVKRCPRNAVYDTFSNKCRRFKCGRGQRIVDGECV